MKTRTRIPRHVLAAILLGLFAQTVFSIGLSRPRWMYFDEVHYVRAARFVTNHDRPFNKEHPMVGKTMIAAGMEVFGDENLGWRIPSTLSGTACVVALYMIALMLYGSIGTALLAGGLALVNQLLYVQARIAMLDVHLAAFLLLGLAASLKAATTARRPWPWIAASGVLLGLSTGCKWYAAPFVAAACLAPWALRLRDRIANRRREVPVLHHAGASVLAMPFVLGAVAVATYFATFWPAFLYDNDPMTLARLVPFQREMYALQTQVLRPHPYQSPWWSWPLDMRPIWYLFDDRDGPTQCVLLIGNPITMIGGLLAAAVLSVRAVRARSIRLAAPAAMWAMSWLMWAAIPKSVGFLYYYLVPSLLLALATAAAFHGGGRTRRRVAAAFAIAASGMFVFFLPILSAHPLQNPDTYNMWMWFPRWR